MRFADLAPLRRVQSSPLPCWLSGLTGCGGSAVNEPRPLPAAAIRSHLRRQSHGRQTTPHRRIRPALCRRRHRQRLRQLLTPYLCPHHRHQWGLHRPRQLHLPVLQSQLYVIARGGKPGPAATSANSAIAFVTAIGACNQVVASSQIVLDEVTTVATVYALSQFLTPGANLGASSTNSTGLQNAVATATALADITQGTSPGPTFAANGSSPAARINSLANLLNACAPLPPQPPAPALHRDHPRRRQRTHQYPRRRPQPRPDPGSQRRQPLHSLRHQFRIHSRARCRPRRLDPLRQLHRRRDEPPHRARHRQRRKRWVSSYFSQASLFSPLGKPVLPQGVTGFGLSASYGLAVDANNNAWIPNEPNAPFPGDSVSVLNTSGQSSPEAPATPPADSITPSPSPSIPTPQPGSSTTATPTSPTSPVLASPSPGPPDIPQQYFALPVAAALDGSHNLWVANQAGSSATKVSPDGSSSPISSAATNPPASP